MPNPTICIIAWKRLSRRSELLAEALKAKLLFFPDNIPYFRATFKTINYALRQKPRIIIIQLPQGPLLAIALVLKKLVGCKVVADTHTGFLINIDWKGKLLNEPFVKLLSKVDLVVAHNEPQLTLLPSKARQHAFVVFDPWYLAVKEEMGKTHGEGGYIVFPASFASDEPLEEVLDAVNSLNINLKICVTGNWKRQPAIRRYASDRVLFTGFLSENEFNRLLACSAAIVTGTKREYTALMSAWEAVAYARALAVTDTATLRSMLCEYAVFYNWKEKGSIAKSIELILTQQPNMAAREKLRKRTVKKLLAFQKQLRNLGSASSAVQHPP